MSLGLNYESSGGNFTPICQFDAKAGRMFRRDKEQGQDAVKTDITRSFKAVADMANIEVGWIAFTATGPDFQMMPLGATIPPRPTQEHKQGVRLTVKLAKDCGGDVREIASSAKAFLRGLDELHTAYQAGEKANPGKLPVIIIKDTVPITSGEGAKKTTNYAPVFEITAWVDRPQDLTEKPGAAPETPKQTPPATGSTRVDPPQPVTRTPEPAMAAAGDVDDFG